MPDRLPPRKSIAVQQPYFLPYLGYFALIRQVDTFVLLDSVQFIRRGWIHRNRLPLENGNWFYFGLPVQKTHRNSSIREIRIARDVSWRKSLRRTLEQRYGKAPYFASVSPLIDTLWKEESRLLSPVCELLMRLSGYLGFRTRWLSASEILQNDRQTTGEERIFRICEKLGADEYWNLPGGGTLYRPENFRENGIDLHFIPHCDETESGGCWSILHLAMWNSPSEINSMIDRMMVDSQKS